MNICIKKNLPCIGRDCRTLPGNLQICCREEILEEREVVQNIVDTIDDCSRDLCGLQRVSSKLSFAASVINRVQKEEINEALQVIERFSLLMYEYQEKILEDMTIGDLTCTFVQELKKWFSYHFLKETCHFEHPVQLQSIHADISTIEMALGVCMITDHKDDDLDDLFF